MGSLHVSAEQGDRFAVSVGSHVVLVDQRDEEGGGDSGPTPVELFVASLASCVAHYARGYLRRHDLPTEGLAVDAQWHLDKNPSRVGGLTLTMTLPEGVPADRHDAVLAMASRCTVHNTLTHAPDVEITLA